MPDPRIAIVRKWHEDGASRLVTFEELLSRLDSAPVDEETVERVAEAIALLQRPACAFSALHPEDQRWARKLARAALDAIGRKP